MPSWKFILYLLIGHSEYRYNTFAPHHNFWTNKHESSCFFCSWVPHCCGQPLWYHNTGCSVSSGGKGHRTSIYILWPNKHLIIIQSQTHQRAELKKYFLADIFLIILADTFVQDIAISNSGKKSAGGSKFPFSLAPSELYLFTKAGSRRLWIRS